MKLEAVVVKDALDVLLISKAAGRFAVRGAKGQTRAAENVEKKRQVTTYYSDGDFPRSDSSVYGPFGHKAIYGIDLLVAAPALVDLSVLDNPESTAAEYAAALAASTDASANADALLDDLIAIIWGIIMDPENSKLGLDYDPSRFVSSVKKDTPYPKGGLVLLSGKLTMTATVLEYPTSEVGIDGVAIDGIVKLTTDQSGGTIDSAALGVKEGN